MISREETPHLVLAKAPELGKGLPDVTIAEAFRMTFDALLRASGRPATDVAKAIGVSQATLTKLRRGQRGASFDMLERMRVAFGVTPSGLFDPDAALAQIGLARRFADTKVGEGAHEVASGDVPDVTSGNPLVAIGGIDVHGLPNQELLAALLTYWGTMSPERRLELLGHGLRLASASPPASAAAGFGRA